MIFDFQQINLGTEMSYILANTVENCKKVRLDITALKNEQTIYATYHIPAEEHIIAHCSASVLGLDSDGYIFTDQAFYIHPDDTVLLSRISYVDFSKYIITTLSNFNITKNINKLGISLFNEEGTFKVRDPSLLLKNTVSIELRKILVAIQSKLCEVNPTAQQEMADTYERIFTRARNEMKCGQFGNDIETVLRQISQEKQFSERAILLLAENQFRLLDKSEYQDFIQSFAQNASTELFQELQNIPFDFERALLSDLSNPNSEFAEAYLNKVPRNLDTGEKYSCYELTVLSCVYARLNRHDKARQCTQVLRANYGPEAACLAEDFVCIHGSRKMKEVFLQLQDGQTLSTNYGGLVDGLGLTPMHYALIMNKNEVAQSLASENHWNSPPLYVRECSMNMAWAYTVLIDLLETPNRNMLLIHLCDEIRPLVDQRFELKEQIEKSHHMIEEIKKNIANGQRTISKLNSDEHFHQETADVQQALDEQYRMRDELISLIDESNERISEIEASVSKLIKEEHKKSEQAIKKMQASANPLENFIFKLYTNNPDCHTNRCGFSEKEFLV